jgi:hypothetical protein
MESNLIMVDLLSVSRFERGRGAEGVLTKETTPPSHVLSEGGVGSGVLTKETSPLSRVSSEGGVEGVLAKETTPPSHNLSEGGVKGMLTKGTPLRLTIRAREGWRVC